uniref:Mucin-5AC-like n=1 Tax=Angiostrongylus cantonensis TaxID=6313 RepID=A0A0K0D1W7_ANGCA
MTMVSSMTTVALSLNSSTLIVEETATETPTATTLPMSTIRETTTITTKPRATVPIATSTIGEPITATTTPNLGTIVWQTARVMTEQLGQPERRVMKAVRILPSVRLKPKNSTLNGTKMRKTNLKLPTLTSRIKALRDKEPEHPLIDLQEFLSVSQEGEGEVKDRNSSTPRFSTVETNGMPEIMEKRVNRELKTSLGGKISRQQSEQTLKGERATSHVEKDPFIIQTNSAGFLIKNSGIEKREGVAMAVEKENDEKKDEDTSGELVIQSSSTSTKKALFKQNSILHEVDGNTNIWDFTRGEERAELLLHRKAIDFLRAKIESLEKQLTKR